MYSNNDSALTGFLAGRADNNCCNGNSNGMWGGGWDGLWGIIILAMIFGWGNGFGGFGGWGGNAGATGAAQFTDAAVQRGFDTQTIIGKLDGISNGICDSTFALNNTIVNGFNGVSSAICNLGYENAQLSNATQVAMMQGFNAAQAQAADCCCKTQTAIAGVQNAITGLGCSLGREIERGFCDVNYNMATNTNSLMVQAANNTRDIIDSNREGTRAILDYLCQEKISDLQSENQALRLAASQERQNNYLVNTLRPTAQPAYLTCNPFTGMYGGYGAYGFNGYGYNNGCGCNSGCCGCNG